MQESTPCVKLSYVFKILSVESGLNFSLLMKINCSRQTRVVIWKWKSIELYVFPRFVRVSSRSSRGWVINFLTLSAPCVVLFQIEITCLVPSPQVDEESRILEPLHSAFSSSVGVFYAVVKTEKKSWTQLNSPALIESNTKINIFTFSSSLRFIPPPTNGIHFWIIEHQFSNRCKTGGIIDHKKSLDDVYNVVKASSKINKNRKNKAPRFSCFLVILTTAASSM